MYSVWGNIAGKCHHSTQPKSMHSKGPLTKDFEGEAITNFLLKLTPPVFCK